MKSKNLHRKYDEAFKREARGSTSVSFGRTRPWHQ